MKGTTILKVGIIGWLGYQLLKGKQVNPAKLDDLYGLPPTTPTGDGLTTWLVTRSQYTEVPSVTQIPPPKQDSIPRLDLTKIFKEALNEPIEKPAPVGLIPSVLKVSLDPGAIEQGNWIKHLRHPAIVVILGGRGKGKSALGYRLLEHLRWMASAYVVGLPKDARKHLPTWIGMAATLEDVPPDSIILVDEGYLAYHARRSMAANSVEMSQILNLSRQRKQTLIFVTQEARQLDKNIASSGDVIIFKDLGIMQLEFERRELGKIAANAKESFAGISPGDKKKWSYVYSPGSEFAGLVQNSLPSFWSEKLSHIFALGGELLARAPEKTPLSQRIEKAKLLRQQGLSLGQIANQMGVSKGTIKNWLENYPYKRQTSR